MAQVEKLDSVHNLESSGVLATLSTRPLQVVFGSKLAADFLHLHRCRYTAMRHGCLGPFKAVYITHYLDHNTAGSQSVVAESLRSIK